MTAPPTTPPTAPRAPRDQLREFVARRASAWQARYLDGDPRAAATLARLRRAVGTSPGNDVSAWAEALTDLPGELLGRGDAPSRYETAAHAALTLHALHQQSQGAPMHRSGSLLGRSLAALARDGGTTGVERRFHQLGTSESVDEALVHLRSLVTQLRTAGVPLDYARLADDLVEYHTPVRRPFVRLRWAREYYRTNPTPTTPTGEQS